MTGRILAADRLKVTFAVACLTLTAAACGAAMNSSSASGASGPLKEARCMRSHGVPNFPDPQPGGPSVIPNWINPQAPLSSLLKGHVGSS